MESGGDFKIPEKMDADLVSVYKDIAGIKHALERVKEEKQIHATNDLEKYQQMLDAIDMKRGELGLFGGSLQSQIPAGQAACKNALDQAYDILADLAATACGMNEEMKHTYTTLCGIRRKLQNVKKQKSQSKEDVGHYQQMLNGIHSKRVDGIFCGSPQTSVPSGQAQCAEVLARCYELLDELKLTAQDLNKDMEALLLKLTCIVDELRKIKCSNERESMNSLGFFYVELRDVENARDEEDIFHGNLKSGHIPAGQAICSDILAECHNIIRELVKGSNSDQIRIPQPQC